ncbi:proteasome subunit beta type-6-like [Dysidea avara]|uniref:proteasome subunit beta type-6-like n=1 Tax=Dysidea avara TaxID=196820 RepID=UPI003317A580
MALTGVMAGPAPDWMTSEHLTGTSIMAVEYDGGVIIGADSRTSTGSYVANRVTDKLTPVMDKIYCCRSGSAADTQAIADIVSYNLKLHSIELGEEPLVKSAASLFRQFCYDYRDSLLAGIICAGWDKKAGGQVYSIPLGGMCLRQPFAIGGSGSTYIYGYCDAHFKQGMTKEECIEFVKTSLALAVGRDGSSGGVIRIASIEEGGVERRVYTGTDIPKFYDDGV